MSSPSSVLSRTLQSITSTKIRELEKQRTSYELHKSKVVNDAERAGEDQRKRVSCLLSGVKELDPSSSTDVRVSNIRRWLDQSHYDPSIPNAMLQTFEKQLLSKLDIRSRKFDLADLYSRLLTDWLNPPDSTVADSTTVESLTLDDPFEIIGRDRLQQLRDKFESVVFTPFETDEVGIDNYIRDLFPGDTGTKALEQLRLEVKAQGDDVLANSKAFNDRTLRWCINGLLKNDLLSNEKKAILQDFLQNEVVLGEIADVLNMRFADIKKWSWAAEDEGMPVEPRRQLNGKYRIMMDEDVLQAIFLHYIGITWSVSIKKTLRDVIHYTSLWKQSEYVPQDEADRRQYYLGEHNLQSDPSDSLESERQEAYRQKFFLSQLPSSVDEGARGYDDDDDDDKHGPIDSPNQIKQQLLRQLATEVLIRQSLDGEVAVVQSDLQWFGTGLPHSTIFAVLRFIGIPEDWITFFKRFLEAPLNMGPVSEDSVSAGQVRVRKRGVPMAHALEQFFGELVLFIMDLAVNQEAGILLYRLHDDLWLCGQPKKCAQAWRAMQHFSEVMGLEFNRNKTGSVYLTSDENSIDEEIAVTLPRGAVSIGFLKLDANTGNWVIDQEQVDAHLQQLQKQLASCNSVLSWVQTWNSCIGRFFNRTFGEPANCFGRHHVDNILETHERMQHVLFDGRNGNGNSVTEHLKRLIAERFSVSDVPDAFLFMPEQLGGLGLHNPFISLFLVREQLYNDPEERMRTFLADEKQAYKADKETFEALTEQTRRRRFRDIYSDDYDASSCLPSGNINSFMSMQDYTLWRESASLSLCAAYRDLLHVPEKKGVAITRDVEDALEKLAEAQPKLALSQLDSEKKWIVQFHSGELFERCGGLSLVDKSSLPLGVLTMLRNKVTWQMVL
ncbi:hypothetical protein MMC24_002732 [Lignoscripta atroalba]|nr:hypothetical protein [Lignoscripta atroalba]